MMVNNISVLQYQTSTGMTWPIKKIITIILAALLGVGIVFFAWMSTNVSHTENDTTADSTAWQDSLNVVPEASSTKQIASNSTQEDFANEEATSTTSIIARKLLDDYATVQSNMSTTTMSDAEVDAFTQNLLKNAPSSSSDKQYTEKNLTIIDDSSSSIDTYKKEAAQALSTFFNENDFSELSTVNKALDSRSTADLAPLATAVTSYQKLIASLLSIKVPRSEVSLHLYILKTYTTILSGVLNTQKILEDPIVGLQGIAKYNSGMQMIAQTGVLFGPKN